MEWLLIYTFMVSCGQVVCSLELEKEHSHTSIYGWALLSWFLLLDCIGVCASPLSAHPYKKVLLTSWLILVQMIQFIDVGFILWISYKFVISGWYWGVPFACRDVLFHIDSTTIFVTKHVVICSFVAWYKNLIQHLPTVFLEQTEIKNSFSWFLHIIQYANKF